MEWQRERENFGLSSRADMQRKQPAARLCMGPERVAETNGKECAFADITRNFGSYPAQEGA
jgi:hypothetical protein